MGMRFDKVDPRLYVDLGAKLGAAFVQSQAADAHAEGMKQSTQTTSNYGAVDPNAVYAGTGADGTMTNAEAASFGVYVPAEDKAAGTGVTRQYGLGANPKFQDAEFTPEQQRMSGLKSQAAFYAGRGDTDKSNKILAQMQQSDLAEMQMSQAKTSGKMADLQLGAAQEEAQTKTFQKQLIEAIASGPDGIDAFYKNKYKDGLTSKTVEDGKGGLTITRTNADGQVVGTQAYASRFDLARDALMFSDPKMFVAEQKEKRAEAREDKKDKTENRRLDITENYYTGMLGINRDKVDGKNASLDEKMSEPDKLAVRGIQDQIGKINDALTKAYADGSANPASPTPGLLKLEKDMRTLMGQREGILSRYAPQGIQKPDPAGFGAPAPGSKPTSTSSQPTPPKPESSPSGEPARKLTKMQQDALDKDIPGILARERDDALQRLAAGDERAKTDLVAIEREIARLTKGSVPAPRAPTMTAAAAPAQPNATPIQPSVSMTGTVGDRQLKEVAIKNGYKPVTGRDGKTYFSRVVNGQGENLTEEQLAKRLNVGI